MRTDGMEALVEERKLKRRRAEVTDGPKWVREQKGHTERGGLSGRLLWYVDSPCRAGKRRSLRTDGLEPVL